MNTSESLLMMNRGAKAAARQGPRQEWQGTQGPLGHPLAVTCDVLVIGSGACGLTAAISACMHGLDVRVVEKESLLGGASAYSYGTLWVPGSAAAERAGRPDNTEAALTYLRHEMGRRFDEARLRTYLRHAPRMMDFFERHGVLQFICRDTFADHHPQTPGASAGGRTVFVAPCDGRELGDRIRDLRPPLATQTLMGMMYTPTEVRTMQTALRSWRSFRYTAKRLLRHVLDIARCGRTLWLTNGNALVARLLKAADGLAIPIWKSTPLLRLEQQGGRISGAVVQHEGHECTIHARRGVVLACGGFGWNADLCRELFERPQLDGLNWSLATPGNTGDGLRAAMSHGAQLERDVATAGFWAPVSRSPAASAPLAGHFHDRHRPGFLAVNSAGHRFANEALSNHHFAEAIVKAAAPGTEPVAWLLCDHRSLRRVGCGDLIAPWPAPLTPHLRAGYLHRAASVAALAAHIGVDATALTQTVDAFNASAATGKDDLFGKGETVFDRHYGDHSHQPNPCLGPLGRGPYYAVRLTAGHMGTLVGLKTDLTGRVLNAAGRPLAGLYAVGNDMANVFAGACPGGGITLGPGMTFAHLAAQHLAGLPIEGIAEIETPEPALAA